MTAIDRFDGLPIAVDLQHRPMRVEYSAGRERQIVARREADAARCHAAGIDQTVDDQAAAIDGYGYLACPEAVTDDQIALFQVETEAFGEACIGQRRAELREIGR